MTKSREMLRQTSIQTQMKKGRDGKVLTSVMCKSCRERDSGKVKRRKH